MSAEEKKRKEKKRKEKKRKEKKRKEKKRVAFIGGKYRRCYEPENHVNYSCNLNTTAINYCDVAIRDIKSGEEITSTPTFDKLRECNCGSKKCKNNKQN
jgi:hypothetical protein